MPIQMGDEGARSIGGRWDFAILRRRTASTGEPESELRWRTRDTRSTARRGLRVPHPSGGRRVSPASARCVSAHGPSPRRQCRRSSGSAPWTTPPSAIWNWDRVGLTYANFRAKLVKKLGPNGERMVSFGSSGRFRASTCRSPTSSTSRGLISIALQIEAADGMKAEGLGYFKEGGSPPKRHRPRRKTFDEEEDNANKEADQRRPSRRKRTSCKPMQKLSSGSKRGLKISSCGAAARRTVPTLRPTTRIS